jgi:WD40 repeat protein
VTSIGWDKRVQVWESQTGTISHVLTGHKQGVASAAFSYDGKSICTSSPDGTIRLWHLDTGREMVHFTPEGVGADKLRFSRDNQLLLIFGREQTWTLRVPSLRTIDEELSKKHSTEKTS